MVSVRVANYAPRRNSTGVGTTWVISSRMAGVVGVARLTMMGMRVHGVIRV